MTKNEILDYVMNTPDNTNRMVLSDMLDEFSSSGGGGELVVNATEDGGSHILDKTWQEIYDVVKTGAAVSIAMPSSAQDAPDDIFSVVYCGKYTYDKVVYYYVVRIARPNQGTLIPYDFISETASEYPTDD